MKKLMYQLKKNKWLVLGAVVVGGWFYLKGK